MKLSFDADTEAVRRQFSEWLDANLPTAEEAVERPNSTAQLPEWARQWQRRQFDAGWLVPGNPPEFGGRNATLIEQFVVHEELARRAIDSSFNPQGLGIIVPSILTFGTDEQKAQWAVPVLKGDMTAALGMSEPNAGSDLAGLRTRAVRDGDRFIVNGQKIWTSGAHDADFILTFVRTDPDAPKHKGISALIIPTSLDGIQRRPFASFTSREDLDLNLVFLDDVAVPTDNLVGPLNGGWQVANGSLGHERAMLWLEYGRLLDGFLNAFTAAVEGDPRAEDPLVLDWLATAAIDCQALKLLGYRTLAKTRRGMVSQEQSILKLLGSEANQRAFLNAVEALGPDAIDQRTLNAAYNDMQSDAYNAPWFERYQRTFATTIPGGTSEIQRNIIAERVLGLPR